MGDIFWVPLELHLVKQTGNTLPTQQEATSTLRMIYIDWIDEDLEDDSSPYLSHEHTRTTRAINHKPFL